MLTDGFSLQLAARGIAPEQRWFWPRRIVECTDQRHQPAGGLAAVVIDGDRSVHDLHVWSLSAERLALTAHRVIERLDDWPHILREADTLLRERYHIEHPTLQPESDPGDEPVQISEPETT